MLKYERLTTKGTMVAAFPDLVGVVDDEDHRKTLENIRRGRQCIRSGHTKVE